MSNGAPQPALPGVAVVAADHRVRDSLASLLVATGRVEVTGVAGDLSTAVSLADRTRPDVIVVDPGTADPDGTGLVGRLREQLPGARILVVAWDGRSDVILPSRADGVLDANDLPGALLSALPSEAPESD